MFATSYDSSKNLKSVGYTHHRLNFGESGKYILNNNFKFLRPAYGWNFNAHIMALQPQIDTEYIVIKGKVVPVL